jgi:hypothetical protein
MTLAKTDAARRIGDMIQARGVEYERAIEARREQKREQERRRKRVARERQTSDQASANLPASAKRARC